MYDFLDQLILTWENWSAEFLYTGSFPLNADNGWGRDRAKARSWEHKPPAAQEWQDLNVLRC